MFACISASAYAQTDTIRYVHPNGAYNNDGKSWATAFNRVQDAINSLRDYLAQHYLHSGSVYIAAGNYTPTESTESSGGSILNTSFKIYGGIHVYGGFNPDSPEEKPGDRIMANGKKCSENWADQSGIGTVSGTDIASQWDLKYKTVLSGNHTSTPPSFVFDSIRGRYNITFPASSFHVVWFATNGKFGGTGELADHFRPLADSASVDGCVISSGNASTKNTIAREHTAYGGGVYMVGKSGLRNCIVERCNATMRGGGIYTDGGGAIEFCLVKACQSAGVGVYQGYGGGVCIDYGGSIGHSHITSCAARCGGGLMICHIPEEHPTTIPAIDDLSNYAPFATACVINNNTANAEGGGIYLAEGGTINHCTVTANCCTSADVTYYGRRHGRSGGIYIRNCGMIFNSVFWGNRCDINNDIQFASVRQKTGDAAIGYEIFVYHTAFMNHDITDWTGVRKESVYSLDKHNMPEKGGADNFPCFFEPTVDPLNWNLYDPANGIHGAGVLAHMRLVDIPGPRIWHLSPYSYLDQKGVQWSPAMVDPPTWLVHAHTDYGVVSNPFEPASTLGALVRRPNKMRHAMIAPQGLEGRKDATPIPTIFVDLHHEGEFDGEGHFIEHPYTGHSWEAPLHSIGDALMYYRTYLVETPGSAIGSRAHYHLPTAWDEDYNPTAYADYDYVQILVKEGEQSTAGPNNYLGKDMRTASIRTLSHMRLYGGYPKTLTGTDTEGRNPLNYPTIITANIADEKGVVAYANNSAHVFTYVNTEYTIVDGFQLLNGNAHNLTGTRAVPAGGGVLVSNEITDADKRIDMVGNELRNCRIANNSAPRGAAIYVTGDSKKRIGFFPVSLYAELKVVNCIIRNNTADYSSGNNGVITANGRAFIDIDHCDIVNNVGYPLQSDNRWWYDEQSLPFRGNIRIDNSLIYCNGTEVLNDRSMLASSNVLSVDADGQDYVFGTYNMFDADIQLHTADATQPHGFFKSDFTIDKAGVLPTGMPNAANHPLNLAMPAEKYNQCNLTRTDRNASTYPVFINPSRNIGHSAEGDRPLFGGKVSFIPLNNNPCVNAASVSAYGANNVPRPDAEDFDLTDNKRRNYGGEPDIGALEDTDLPISGSVIYVTPNGAGKRDGSSWANAIAGNTVYVLNDIAGPALATGDQIDPELTCDRILDSEGNPILTTNEKYNGGFGRVWMNSYKIYSTTSDVTTHDYITEKSIYTGRDGDGEGREEIDGTRESEELLPDGEAVESVPEGFEAGYHYDPRYPYGEISGASRSFWRANPYHSGTDWNNASAYKDRAAFFSACNLYGWINNTRAERYVGGLQYAVEKASAANKSYHRDSVQVWVGAGTYNDYKGFVMRDSVTVLGGFPATKYSSPGITERQALMSSVVSIPKAKQAEKLNAADYETILQISDENPNKAGDHTTLNSDAVKYWDDDIDFVENSVMTGDIETDRVITKYYTWNSEVQESDVTSTYYMTSNFYDNQIQNETTVGDFHSLDFGTATAEKDCWHLTYTGNASTSGSNGVIGRYETNQMSYSGHTGQVIFENGQALTDRTTNDGLAIRNGSLSGVQVWQMMKNVPAGSYKIKVDLNAYYRSGTTVKDNNVPTGVKFIVLDYKGDTLVNEPINAKNKKGASLNQNIARWQLNRYTFNLTQPADGSMKISIEIGTLDGAKGDNREALMENFKLIRITPADQYILTDETDVRTPHPGSIGSSEVSYSSTIQKHRTPLRKRVLTMPDVCVPTYGAGSVGDPTSSNRGKYGDDLSHTHRVFGPSKAKRSSWKNTDFVKEDPNYVEYNEANWDGFTIRHGLIHEEGMGHGGGAGVNMYEGAHLRNCIVINNMSKSGRVKGGGIYCDGATATIEGCFVLNNISTKQNANSTQSQIFSGGMFLYEGTCFNSLFANNYSFGSAGGVGFCVGKFYNNTIAYNTCSLSESGHINGGAISVATESTPNLFVANTIVYGNSGMALRERTETAYQGVNLIHPFINCYIQTDVAFTQGTYRDNIINYSDGKYGKGNVLLQEVPSAATTPFAADFVNGIYTPGNAAATNDFRLRDDVPCVNKGTEDFAGDLMDVLMRKHNKTEDQVEAMPIYQSVDTAQLPDNDVAFAKRVQDCQIDMGAYEFNAAYSIKPDTTTHPGQAIFYVTFDTQGGNASADSPENAACKQKLQLVIDAAGRYKNSLMTLPTYNKGTAGEYVAKQPNKHWSVEVWLEGDDTNSTVSGEYADWYTPTRSTKHNMENYVDNTLDYSFIIPHGVVIKGGFTTDFTGRDPLTYRTVLSGKITSSTGAEGNTFHVVTFTNDLFTPDETYFKDGDDPVRNQLASMTNEKDRAVLDGLFIMHGHANSPDLPDRIGAAAVVTKYAHIRNCVIQDNTAEAYGGGLYLKPSALVSGTIIKNNTAEIGGGIYVEAPAPSITMHDSLAHVFYSTICENTGRASAGGLFFDNTYARINSTAIWHNEASDNANISGSFSRSSANTEYPLSFCAVESRRLEGQGNLELSPTETEGVRWDRLDPFDAILYYPIEMSSTLSRAGMTYKEMYKNMGTYATLDSIDIAGVSRTKWTSPGTNVPRGFAWGSDTLVTKNNDMIEIGARAINKNYQINVNQKYVMNRLYVMHTDLINSEAARALQDNRLDNDTANMYRQMGSCILNPFHRLGDAFDYIIAARKSDPATYRNRVFSVFIEAGTYYPYHNAYGEQDEVRNNTFLVPEAIYVIGGVDSRPEDHHYGQEGFFDMFTGAAYGSPDRDVNVRIELPNGDKTSYTINASSLDSIRLRDDRHRPMRDNNLNSVIEPWELERQTILSGNAVSGEDFTHVYHVVTMHADSNYVGPQPLKFRHMNPDFDRNNLRPGIPMLIDPIRMDRPDEFKDEIDQSILGRTTEFDGIQFTGGYANHLDETDTLSHHYVTKTYFRGGGIFVDGNWTETFDAVDNKNIPNVTEPAKYNIPIVVENCFFTNNMAGNGGGLYSNGGIYMYGCRFTQNYSQGPMTELDQKFIPWTAGGCIATNADCDVSNTLFDNNEARRGMYPITVAGDEYIPDADARQGFGGVLSVAAQSRLRSVNCHYMRNKAVAYPSIYNFLANNHYSDPDSMQFAFNSIFWGNEVFEVEHLGDIYTNDQAVPEESEKAFEEKYKGSRSGVFHYDPDEWDKYERLLHEYDSTYAYWTARSRRDTFNNAVTDKLDELREQGNKIEGLYFCSYRKGYGPSAMKPSSEGYLLTKAEQESFTDPRSQSVNINDKGTEDYTDLFSHVKGNNNVLINRLNTATDGPNFKQPTFVAGIDGYMQNADWLLARMNLTTDQGWGHLKQTVTREIAYYITEYTGKKQYKTQEEALEGAKEVNPSATVEDVYPVSGLPEADFDALQPSPGAIYNFYSARYGAFMSKINAPLPLGKQYYMAYTRTTSDTETSGNMDRISKNPKFGIEDAYIDIGIYEYQYVQLDIEGQEIDTMWVATKAKDPLRQDGLTWETPTTDLQTAIDMLMSSHNNHDKYICFLGDKEGTFSPQNVIDNRRAFIITSNTLAPIMPDSASADFDYGINSINFLGGYSYDVKDAARNPQENPVVIEMPNIGSAAQRNQLFIIEDMTRQMVQVNWQGEYISRDSVVIPVSFDGITFINPYSTKGAVEEGLNNLGGLMSKKGGAAIYYRWQRRYENTSGSWAPNFNYALHPDSALIDGEKMTLPKLTISNCIFMDNGERTSILEERSPAVRIDHGGGSSLIVNSLFHSNAGAAIYSKTFDEVEGENDLARVPNDVIIMNSTFALNDGHIRLESANSEVHNSLIWLDDLAHDTLTQLQMGTDTWDKTTNKNREGIENRMTHNAVWGCFQNHGAKDDDGDTYKNHPLATDNNDIFGGPGFVLPNVHATTSDQRRERSFRLNPSLRTVNMADSTVYKSRVFFRVYPDTSVTTHGKYWRRPNGFKGNTIEYLVNDSDLAAKPRLSGPGMDRGAYECLAQLQRVLYVQPDKPAFAAGDGSSWTKPFGQGQLQNAIDAAAVYTYLAYGEAKRESRKAYVFVKGTYESQEPLNIHARDGVFVYGSLPNAFNDTASKEDGKFSDAECQRYVNYVRAYSVGVASPKSATPTRVHSIHIEGDDFTTGCLFDGFEITNNTLRTEPALIIDNEFSAIRNCVIKNTKIKDTVVAVVNRGLLYNCLFYNDSAKAIVELKAGGLALNNTIVTDNADITPLDVTDATSGASENNLALNTATDELRPFAPYFTNQVPYSAPEYLSLYKPLSYQLHEHSLMINAGTADNELPELFNTYVNDSTIAFRHDRDVLGNPRKIGSAVDQGALETWRVEKKTVQEITTLTNKIGSDAPVAEHKFSAFLQNYGGNKYPHEGSVVYLMDSSTMAMGYEDEDDFLDFNGDPIVYSPGFMLLKSGASLFGNGHIVQLNYLATEKRFKNQRFSMTAFPFHYNAGDITVTGYNAEKDSLILNSSPFAFNTYQYNGAARSAKDYVFQTENSSLWRAVDTLNRTATDGYLMDFGELRDTVLRFTAFADEPSKHVYSENGSDKSIFLTQYDNKTAGDGAALDFTRQEDMGWNMKGLPWLVSNYRTDTILWAGNYLRQMYIPHVLYQMDGSTNYSIDGDRVYTTRSWDRGSTLSMGSAFLTQTATTAAREEVIFYLPLSERNRRAPRPVLELAPTPVVPAHSPAREKSQISNVKSQISNDILSFLPDAKADKSVQYTYGRDGVKWIADAQMPQIYLMDTKRLSRISFLGAAPTETDIPLGVSIPDASMSNDSSALTNRYTFRLPEKEAFVPMLSTSDDPSSVTDGQSPMTIWLIDYTLNRFTNLMEENYEVELSPGENNSRFAIRIGSFPKATKQGQRQYIVYAAQGTLYVRGIIPGDHIAIHTVSGQLIKSLTASDYEFTMPVDDHIGYIVQVNDTAHKALNH